MSLNIRAVAHNTDRIIELHPVLFHDVIAALNILSFLLSRSFFVSLLYPKKSLIPRMLCIVSDSGSSIILSTIPTDLLLILIQGFLQLIASGGLSQRLNPDGPLSDSVLPTIAHHRKHKHFADKGQGKWGMIAFHSGITQC